MTDEPIDKRLSDWWAWSLINSGMPRGYSRPGEALMPSISDEEVEAVERAVCQLKACQPEMALVLETYLRCRGNLAETAQRLHCATNTARLYVQNAMSWVAGWMQRDSPPPPGRT